MGLPLAWLSQCCHHLLLPSWAPILQGSWRCCSQGPRSTAETSSTRNRKMSPSRERQPRPTAELAQAEELLEQQLELYQALVEGQEGAWEAQALVLKTQKLKEQMRRHREPGRSHLSFPSVAPSPSSPENCTPPSPTLGSATSQPLPGPKKTEETATKGLKIG
ncbi:PREDICTED: mitochondrial coiled-coil domain protein 1 [Bison bison bison]|uniref:Mitochondrial coiled-coil domain protein 1 n=1 Tax=Bison bison bison TaxID=43346 RepID=A0A6P3GPZ8_BISBB|nr:PREDICTED: mitochondrial coiled-coil domain protein 1 [Bison bison bison]